MPEIKVGDKIRIIKMEGEPEYTNRIGIVEHIDCAKQIHGTWGGCALIPEEDKFELIQWKRLPSGSLFFVN